MKAGLDLILQLDSDLFENIINGYQSAFAKRVSESPFPQTGRALYMLFSKATLIKDAIFRQAADGDIHTMVILYRAYIDHFLKHVFICIRHRESESDEIGIQYHRDCLIKNELDSVHGLYCSMNIFSEAFAVPRDWEGISRFLEFEEDEAIAEEGLRRRVEQFSVPSILRYLSDEHLAGRARLGDLDMYRRMAFDYFEYESYVLGEPWTDRDLLAISDELRRGELVAGLCEKIFNSFCALTSFNYGFLLSMDATVPDLIETIDGYRLR
jgi:hypothetical protein